MALLSVAFATNSLGQPGSREAYPIALADAQRQGSATTARSGPLQISSPGAGRSAAGAPRAALAADFDADGVNDLVVAHDGQLVYRRGNIDAFAPRTQAAWEAIRDGRFVPPFEQETRTTALPVAADFVAAGDFNRDTRLDLVVAARGASVLYLLEGDGAGSFATREVAIAGVITAVASGDVNRADGLPDIVVGARAADGAGLHVFSAATDIFAEKPARVALPSPAEAMAVAQLDNNNFADIAVGTASELILLSGKDSNESVQEAVHLPLAGGVKSIVTGDFVPDRDSRTELAVLSADGTIRIFARGALDTRPVSKSEHRAAQVREYQKLGYPVPERILATLTEDDFRAPVARTSSDAANWTEVESVAVASNASVLTTGRISEGAADDLIVVGGANGTVSLLPFHVDESQVDPESTQVSFAGKRSVEAFTASGSPVAALALKLNHTNDEDLLVVQDDGGIAAFVDATTATFTVTSAADDIDNNLGNGVCGGPSGCTLRAAIMEANRLPGDDTIMINAGINPTISRGQPDNDGQGTNDQASGDLDITCVITNPSTGACTLPLASNDNDLSIIGAAGGNTVTAGTFAPYAINGGGSVTTDRVFDVGQDGIFGGGFGGSTGVSATFTNLTIQGGNTKEAINTALGGGNRPHGGGIRSDAFRSGGGHGTLTITNTIITNNQSAHHAGGISQVTGSFTASGSTFSNNIAHVGEGGGLFFGAATSASNVSITNSSFISNEARRGTVYPGSNPGEQFTGNADGGGVRINADPNTVTINNTNFTNNIAQQDGGAIKTLGALVTVTGGTMTGNTARRHGGVAYGDEDTPNSPAFVTFSGSTMRNNIADSDNTIFPGPPGQPQFNDGAAGDGGAVFRDRGTLTLTNCIIGGTGAAEPNTATNGGGVAHAFTVDSAAGNSSNQTQVTINGGSINGNIAQADGGGVYFNATLFDVTASTLSIGANSATAMSSNRAKNNGGALHIAGAATATLNNMTLRSNQANSDTSGGGDGGALYQNAGTTSFTGTLTIGGSGFANTAVNGGGVRNNAGTINIPASATITHNLANGTGGGIHNTGTLGTLTNVTVTNNSAASGGGIFSSSGNLVVSGGSISTNTAGGGIVHGGAATSSVTGATISNNTGHGILITANSIDVANNTITGNSLDGIAKTGAGNGSHFNSNIFSGNGGIAVDLGDNGVTANDANDVDTGANNLQNYPLLNFVRRGTGVGSVTLNAPNGKYRIQYYANTACDPSGNGEGEALLTSEVKDIVAGNTLTFFSIPLAFGTRELISATATHDANGNGNFDDDGSTSEFAVCKQVNRLPTISAASPSKQQGSPVGSLGIATVADQDQAANTLVMTVNGGASATVNGVTLSNMTITANGTVNADVIASCTATNATFTVRVTDLASEFNETSVTVSVAANTAPTLGDYPGTAVLFGTSGSSVTPTAAPGDNGSVATVVATSPTFTGTFAGSASTGIITVNNAGPVGPHTVTVTATDNCGTTSTKQFTLTVNRPPSITSANATTFVTGTAGTFSVTTLGYPAPGLSHTGTLPSGVTFVDNANGTATLAGTPAAGTGGVYAITITAANGIGSNATQNFTLTVNQPPAITSADNTSFTVGTAGSFQVTATGYPSPTFALNGTLPAGITLGAVSGVLGGTPAPDTQGVYQIGIVATNGVGSGTTQPFTLTINGVPCTAAASGLISWLPGNGNANDLLGSNHAVMQSGATFAAGKVGQAFNFTNAPNASSGQHATVATPVGLPVGNAARTVELWFRTATDLSASPNAALIQYGAPAIEQTFGLVTTATAPGKLYFNGGGDDLAGATTLQPNTWYHAAVTYDGTTVRLYLNGQLESSKATTLLNTTLNASGLTIGLRPATSVWNGLIDEIDIFNRALSLAEIQAIYYAGAQGKCAPALSLTNAVSRKTHANGVGAKDVPMPLTGSAGIEPRNGTPAGTHTIVFSFTNSVTSGSAAVSSGTGSVNGAPTFSGNTMTVNLTGVTNAQQITVTLTNVTDALGQVMPTTGVNMKFLSGDANGDGAVNSGDAIVTRNRSGQTTDNTNFRSDINLDGTINVGDASLVKSASGTSVAANEE